MKAKLCPCNSDKQYQLCCRPFHKGKLNAPTAEALMRSRYSAYVLNEIQYVYRTWDEKTRPSLKMLREDNSRIFINLNIINVGECNETDATATVEFIASYIIKNDTADYENNQSEIYQHHENSYFVKHTNKWRYVNEMSKIEKS